MQGVHSVLEGLANARPGDVFEFTSTELPFRTYVDGTKENPITIRGIGPNAKISKLGSGLNWCACAQINHDYYILENFMVEKCDKGVMSVGGSHGIVRNVIAQQIVTTFFQFRANSMYWLVENCIARDSHQTPGADDAGTYGEGYYVGTKFYLF
jgi:hypothetical protein